ncbi:MAG: hypothetical protein NVS3B1_02070 [Marmoricola sp.]
MDSFRYTNLSNAIRAKSPLRAYLDEHFGERWVTQKRYRAQGGPLVVPGTTANPQTMGTAFDTLLKMRFDPLGVPVPALQGSFIIGNAVGAPFVDLVQEARDQVADRPDLRCRLAWLYALCTEAGRAGVWSPLLDEVLARHHCTVDDLLGLATPDAISELDQLDRLAEVELIPHLGAPVEVGPAFKASRLCSADADLIADRKLVEVKTTIGRAAKDGRKAILDPEMLNQMVAYALFDTDDRYHLNAIALYSARFGYYVEWPLQDLLDELSSDPDAAQLIDIAEEREAVWSLLGGEVDFGAMPS